MNFLDAVSSMMLGKNVTRSKWTEYYAAILPKQKYIWTVGVAANAPVVTASIYTPSVEDINATDWFTKE